MIPSKYFYKRLKPRVQSLSIKTFLISTLYLTPLNFSDNMGHLSLNMGRLCQEVQP